MKEDNCRASLVRWLYCCYQRHRQREPEYHLKLHHCFGLAMGTFYSFLCLGRKWSETESNWSISNRHYPALGGKPLSYLIKLASIVVCLVQWRLHAGVFQNASFELPSFRLSKADQYGATRLFERNCKMKWKMSTHHCILTLQFLFTHETKPLKT